MNTKRSSVRTACLSLLGCLSCGVLMPATPASGAVATVTVANNVFQPSSTTINVNDQVNWRWSAADGATPHTTTSDTPGLWDSGIHTQPFEFTMAFPSEGRFPYRCTLHATIGMRGTVTVQAGGTGAPTITTQPRSQTVSLGATVTFSVMASGAMPLSYQWRKNGNDIGGATASSLVLNDVEADDAGNYSVVVSNAGGSVTSSAAVLTVQPFVKGNYNGLFYVSSGVAQESSGNFTLSTAANGKFSGRLQNGSNRLSLSGQFDTNGFAQKTLSRRGQSPLDVVLQLDPDDPDKITGTVSDGTFTANLSGDRAVFDGKQSQAPQMGRYTMIISGTNGSMTMPGGDSYGTVIVDKAGRIRLAGSLADGTLLSQAVPVSKAGDWPLYTPLYGGRGSILSWIRFASTGADDLSGDVVWIKPAVPSAKLYPNGFAFSTRAHGSGYQLLTGGAVLSFTNAQVALSGGALAAGITNAITIGTRNRVVNLDTNKLSLTFTASTGLFSGRVVDPATSKPVPFKGVILQKQNLGRGWFQGNQQSGEVVLSSR